MPSPNIEKRREQERLKKRRQRAAKRGQQKSPPRVPAGFRLKTAQDALDVLWFYVQAVDEALDATALEKARTIGYLTSVALRAIEAGDLAARIEALEAMLKQGGAA